MDPDPPLEIMPRLGLNHLDLYSPPFVTVTVKRLNGKALESFEPEAPQVVDLVLELISNLFGQ